MALEATSRKTLTPTAAPTTTTTTSRQDAIRAWHNTTLLPAQEVRDAPEKISKAAEAYDLTTMGIACQELHDAVEQFQQHMPSPDPDLTAQLQKALSDYGAAAAICTTAVENRNIDDFAQGRPRRYHRRLLRTCYLAAQSAARTDPASRAYYERKVRHEALDEVRPGVMLDLPAGEYVAWRRIRCSLAAPDWSLGGKVSASGVATGGGLV